VSLRALLCRLRGHVRTSPMFRFGDSAELWSCVRCRREFVDDSESGFTLPYTAEVMAFYRRRCRWLLDGLTPQAPRRTRIVT
jgi:hypothetical protein